MARPGAFKIGDHVSWNSEAGREWNHPEEDQRERLCRESRSRWDSDPIPATLIAYPLLET
jgi:hypothetical protein